MQWVTSSSVVRKSEQTSPSFVHIFSLTKSGSPNESAEILLWGEGEHQGKVRASVSFWVTERQIYDLGLSLSGRSGL